MSEMQPKAPGARALLLALPIGVIVWVLFGDLKFPLEQAHFLVTSFAIGIPSFALIWFFPYWESRADRRVQARSIFLLMIWNIAVILGFARLNVELDESKPIGHTATIASHERISGPQPALCLVRIEKAFFSIQAIRIPYENCDAIVDGNDTVEFQTRSGGLGLIWIAQSQIVKTNQNP